MKKTILSIILLLVVGGVGVGALIVWNMRVSVRPPVSLPIEAGESWVSIEPIQCLSNPWEIDWIKTSSGGDPLRWDDFYGQYPRDNAVDQIIKNFYQKEGITIFDIKRDGIRDAEGKPIGEFCEACSCAAGYVLYLNVSDLDVEKMESFGYTKYENKN